MLLKGEQAQGNKPLREFSMKEINAQEEKDGRILIAINGLVYDVSNFLDKHPGGDLVLRNVAGKDCTDVFENYHQGRVSQSSLGRLLVGQVSDPQPVYDHVKDFRAVRQELINSGMFQVDKSYYARVYASSAALFVAVHVLFSCVRQFYTMSHVRSSSAGLFLAAVCWRWPRFGPCQRVAKPSPGSSRWIDARLFLNWNLNGLVETKPQHSPCQRELYRTRS